MFIEIDNYIINLNNVQYIKLINEYDKNYFKAEFFLNNNNIIINFNNEKEYETFTEAIYKLLEKDYAFICKDEGLIAFN